MRESGRVRRQGRRGGRSRRRDDLVAPCIPGPPKTVRFRGARRWRRGQLAEQARGRRARRGGARRRRRRRRGRGGRRRRRRCIRGGAARGSIRSRVRRAARGAVPRDEARRAAPAPEGVPVAAPRGRARRSAAARGRPSLADLPPPRQGAGRAGVRAVLLLAVGAVAGGGQPGAPIQRRHAWDEARSALRLLRLHGAGERTLKDVCFREDQTKRITDEGGSAAPPRQPR